MIISEKPSRAKTRITKMAARFQARAVRLARSVLPNHGAPSAPASYPAGRAPLHGDAARCDEGRWPAGDPADNPPVKLYHRSTSPESMNACIAMNFKGIPFEKVLVDLQDQSELIRVSGQPLAPVLWHNGSVVFDSGAILRYLDANFPETPPLFSSNRTTLLEIEQWENLGRGELRRSVAGLLRSFLSANPDMEELEAATRRFQEITGRFEERLERSRWLVEDRLTAADVTTGPSICYGMFLPSVATLRSLGESIAERFNLEADRPRTEAWAMRLMAYNH